MSDSLLVFPAGASYVGNIEAARRAGYEVITVDRDPEAPGFEVSDHTEAVDITDHERVLRVAKAYDVDGIIPLNDYAVPTAAHVANTLDLVGLSSEAADICTDKAKMRTEWNDAELPQPEFAVVESLSDAEDAIEDIGLPVVCKPAVSTGGGSRGVSIVKEQSRLAEAIEFSQTPYDDNRVLIEECIIGTEHSIEVLVDGGDATAVVVSDKEKTPEPYRVDKSVIYPTEISKETRQQVQQICEDAAIALGIENGAAHVELAVNKDGPHLFELGARCGGGATAEPIVRAVTGMDYFGTLCHIYAGKSIDPWEPQHHHGVVYRFLTPEPGTVTGIDGVESVTEMDGVLDCRIYVSLGEEIDPVRVGGDRSGSIITTAPTRAEAIRLANEAEQMIKFEYE